MSRVAPHCWIGTSTSARQQNAVSLSRSGSRLRSSKPSSNGICRQWPSGPFCCLKCRKIPLGLFERPLQVDAEGSQRLDLARGRRFGLRCEVFCPYARGAVLGMGYMLFLNWAYRVGDLSHVYPFARGTAPLIVAIVSVAFLGEQMSHL